MCLLKHFKAVFKTAHGKESTYAVRNRKRAEADMDLTHRSASFLALHGYSSNKRDNLVMNHYPLWRRKAKTIINAIRTESMKRGKDIFLFFVVSCNLLIKQYVFCSIKTLNRRLNTREGAVNQSNANSQNLWLVVRFLLLFLFKRVF